MGRKFYRAVFIRNEINGITQYSDIDGEFYIQEVWGNPNLKINPVSKNIELKSFSKTSRDQDFESEIGAVSYIQNHYKRAYTYLNYQIKELEDQKFDLKKSIKQENSGLFSFMKKKTYQEDLTNLDELISYTERLFDYCQKMADNPEIYKRYSLDHYYSSNSVHKKKLNY